MSSVCNKFAKCDDVIVNFTVRSQTIVKLKEFKEHVQDAECVVLTDKQAKTLFDKWLDDCYGHVDGQQAIVDVDLDDDVNMDYLMDHLFNDVIGYNIDIPDDWHVARCQPGDGCKEISVGTYGEDKTPLCQQHKDEAGYNSEGNKEPEFDGCEHPSPEVKEVEIVSNKPEVIDFFEGKSKPVESSSIMEKIAEHRDVCLMDLVADNAKLKEENAKLKERIRQVVKHFEMMISSIL